jgi:hypothetical protein
VTNQINSTKGQIYFPFIYALFVFILVNNLIGMVNRCLCVIINNIISYNFFIDKKVILYSSFSNSYSSKGNFTNILNPYYITGFADGEGCFNISIYKDSRMLTG